MPDSEDKIVQAFTRSGNAIIYDKNLSLSRGSSNVDFEDGKKFVLIENSYE